MAMLALTAAELLTPLERIEQPLLLLEEGVISSIGPRAAREIPARCRALDFPDAILAPGFLDIHIHGGAGHDVMEPGAEVLPAVERLLASRGVTAYLPTTVTAPLDQTLAALERLADAIEAAAAEGVQDGRRARPLGVHLEGPFLSHAKRGVHPPEHLLPASLKIFDELWQAARGHVKVITIAPEVEGALELIAEATHRGVCVSLGHSNAELAAARAGIAAGGRHATHTFNAMRALDHRHPGILGAVLTDARVTADLIADGIHVDPVVVQLFLQAKGPERAVLISDALSATGMPDGRYRLGALEVEVHGGKCMAGGKLAGSVLTLDLAVRNIMKFAGWELQPALRLATLNPARVAGLDGRKGALAPGKDADIVVLSREGQVLHTMIQGAGV